MVNAVFSKSDIERLGSTPQEIADAITDRFVPIIKQHMDVALNASEDTFVDALVESMTHGAARNQNKELLRRLTCAQARIDELVREIRHFVHAICDFRRDKMV